MQPVMQNHGVELTVAMYNACLDTFSNSGTSRRSSDPTNLTTRSLLTQLDSASGLADINRIKQVLIGRGDFDKGPVVVRIINAIVNEGVGESARVYLALFARNPRVLRIVERDELVKEALFFAFLNNGLARHAKELVSTGIKLRIGRVFATLGNSPLICIPAKIDVIYLLMGDSPPRSRDAIFYCKLFRDFKYSRGLDIFSGQEDMSIKLRVVLAQGYIRSCEWNSAKRELAALNVGICIDVVLRELRREGDASAEELLDLLPFGRVKDSEIDEVIQHIESFVGEKRVISAYRELLEDVRDGRDVDQALVQLEAL
jgi:hypothetical protein